MKFPLGDLVFKAHTPYSRPSSLHVLVEGGEEVRLLLLGRRTPGS